MSPNRKAIIPLVLLFIVLNGFFLTAKTLLDKWNMDRNVLLIANVLLFLLSMFTFALQRRSLQHKNPNVFIRSVIGSTMIKMVVFAAAILAYVLIYERNYNIPALLLAMFLYLVYLAVEVKVLLKMNKEKNA